MKIDPRAAVRELQRREALRQAAAPVGFCDFATRADFCGLELSPLVAAIMLASEGLPSHIDNAMSLRHFGCPVASLPLGRHVRTVVARTGGRGGKTSRLLAPKALHAAWTVPLPTLNPGEVASSLIVAPNLKLARQTLSFVKGYADRSPMLRPAMVGDGTKDDLVLRRHDGKQVRIEILPATARGEATRARTLVFAGLDEACFFYSAETGVINDQDIYDSVFQRVVPGGQVWIASTPWMAGVGLLEAMLARDWGKHERALCVTSGTRAMNPAWDPDGEIEAQMRADNPDSARREVDGLGLAGSAVSFFDAPAIAAAIDMSLTLPRKPRPGEQVTAGGDFGFRSDSSALCVVHRAGRKLIVADLLELRPEGQPLKPSETVRTFAKRLRGHAGLEYLVADSHYRETVVEHLGEANIGFKDATSDIPGTYIRARALLREGRVALPNHPRLIAQLRSVQWRPNPGGTISIVLPRGSGKPGQPVPLEAQGGHCDLVSAFVLAVWEAGGVDVPDEKPKAGTVEAARAMESELERLAVEDVDRMLREEREGRWWE